jgi:outer membrane lipoprotein-sorting protein
MRLMVKGITFLGAVCVLTGTAQAADGLLLVQRITSGATTLTNQVQIEHTRMRTDSSTATGGHMIMIFDGTKQVLMNIDTDKKTYTEMTEADVEKFAAQMSAGMAQLQQMMANMTPEQRKMMESARGRAGAAMAGMAGAAAPAKMQYHKTGTDRVGKWTCDKYEGSNGTERTSEVCTVDPKALGFAATDFEVTKQMAAFFKKMIPEMAQSMAKSAFTVGTPEEQGFSGVPVRQTTTSAGRQTIIEITDVSRQNFPDSVFQVPAGYQKIDMMAGRGRGRQ